MSQTDPRRLERLLKLLRRYDVAEYDPATGRVRFREAAAPAAPEQPRKARPPERAERTRVDPRDPKSVDDFLRARLGPAGGSN